MYARDQMDCTSITFLECHESLLSVETYPINFSFLRKLWVISIIGIMRMPKSKAELPSTDVLVNPQRLDSGTTALNSGSSTPVN